MLSLKLESTHLAVSVLCFWFLRCAANKIAPPTILIPTLEGVPAIPVFELTGYPTRAIGPVVWYVLRGFCPLETALVTISGLALGTA
jgi:hypothetical protein